jgi:hypothetical protein
LSLRLTIVDGAPGGLPRVIATFSNYAGLMDALRQRAQERQSAISSADANDVICLSDSHLAKLRLLRRVKMVSLGSILQLLGVRLLMVEDEKALAWVDARLGKSKQPFVHSGSVQVTLSRHFLTKRAALGGKKSRANMSPRQAQRLARNGGLARAKALSSEQRSAIARKAVTARWRKHKRHNGHVTTPNGGAAP